MPDIGIMGTESASADLSHVSHYFAPGFYFRGSRCGLAFSAPIPKSLNMGITESKIILGKLTTACSVAEQNGHSQVQEILSDKQVGSPSPKFRLSLIIDSL